MKKIICAVIAVLALWGLICTAQSEEAWPQQYAGELTAQRIRFTSGKRYKVYRGPGEEYGRSAGGKGVVSTGDWIQVFGREGDWIMVQYDISSDNRMRIGWIDARALPENAEVPELSWRGEKVSIANTFTLTDDPLRSKRPCCADMPGGTAVTWLSTMGTWPTTHGTWAYVETEENGQPVRGFIEIDRLPASYDVAILRMYNTLTGYYAYSEGEAAEFVLDAVPNDHGGWTGLATHRRYPSWHYELVLDANGARLDDVWPMRTQYAPGILETDVREILHEAEEKGWFRRWSVASRKALTGAMTVSWRQIPPTAALQNDDLQPEEALREFFISCYGPEEGWPEALAEWHAEEERRLLGTDE